MRSPLEVLRLYPPHDGSLIGLLQSRVAVAASRPCLVFEGHSHTYAQVLEAAARTAAVLAARGVGAGDRVAVMSHNHPSTVFLLLALASLGAVMVPINPDYGVAEAHYVLGHAEVCGVVCSAEAWPTVEQACAGLQQRPWCLLNAAPADAREAETPGGIELLDDLLRQQKAVTPLVPAQAADVTGLFIYTSGTTGFPKGVMHSQRTLVAAGECFVARMHLQPEDRLLCVLPLFHINAIFYSLAGALAAGATLILAPRFSASRFWSLVHETGATEVNTIAAATSILLRRPRSEFRPGHALKKIYGAPFDAETYRVFQQEFGVQTLIEGYGMSEIPGVLSNPFDGPHRVGSMGRPSPHPDPSAPLAEPRIADDSGRFLAPGEVGELVVRTPLLMQGYYRDPEQTAAAFRDGWFRTGDLAWVDGEGYFWFVARQKDIIRRRGENISGAELDRVVGSHPAVMEAAAIAVPSELGEDDILVAVVLRPGQQASAEQIGAWCRERLAAAKVPRYVAWVDALPHTPTHRVAKFKLRETLAALRAQAVDLEAVQA